jgi:hypothetical protein
MNPLLRPFVGKLKSMVLVTCLIALTSCTGIPRGYVAREWSMTMRELNITAVFPPREDVYVGDIYPAPVNPSQEDELRKKKGWLPLGMRITSLPVADELGKFYSGRPSFPKTTEATVSFMTNLTNQPFALLPQSSDTNRNIFAAGNDTHRLRMVGFPGFMSATFSQGDLAGVIPVEALNIAFAASRTTSKKVTVSIPVAESYSLSASDMFAKVVDKTTGNFRAPGTEFTARDILRYTAHQHAPVSGTNARPDYGYIRIITEVYYTRAIDVSIAGQRSFGAGANVRPTVSVEALTNITSLGSSNASNQPPTTNYMFSTRTSNAAPEERAAELNRQLTAALAQSTPGGSVKFVSAGDFGVSMRRTYERPVALGYRGLLLKVYTNGVIESVGSIAGDGQGWVPTSK